MSKRILSLDMSSKTGWSLLVSNDADFVLEGYGQIEQIHTPDGQYPDNFVDWAYLIFAEVTRLIDTYAPDVLVIEETAAGSKQVYTQKILEWAHFLLAKLIKECHIEAVYLLTEQWRREVGCVMSTEEKKRNKAVKDYKEDNDTKIAYDTKGKRIGKITRKHVNVRRANEVFGAFLKTPLRKKDEDTADALLLAYCYHLRKTRVP